MSSCRTTFFFFLPLLYPVLFQRFFRFFVVDFCWSVNSFLGRDEEGAPPTGPLTTLAVSFPSSSSFFLRFSTSACRAGGMTRGVHLRHSSSTRSFGVLRFSIRDASM